MNRQRLPVVLSAAALVIAVLGATPHGFAALKGVTKVALFARNAGKVGGPHHNHGWAVSHAAHTCPHPTPTSTGG